jgi:hypothetical protein
MSSASGNCVVLDPAALLPQEWQHLPAQGPVRTFNPGLLRAEASWIFACRVVGADGLRRIALCRLDDAFRVLSGSVVPFSDHVRFRAGNTYPEVATHWFADPRLYRLGGRTWVYWNSGWHEPQNHQFLQEFDSTTLAPIGTARELLLRDERRKLEKNWTLFATGSGPRCFAVYSIVPHRVLELSLEGAGDLECSDFATTSWSVDSYPASHGGLRGGAPPVFAEDQFWSFCHSVHDDPAGYRYAPAVYRFTASPPFAPNAGPTRSLTLGNPFGTNRIHPRLNPAVGEVIYPCGAARNGHRWVISHGINDEYCALSTIPPEQVLATLHPAKLVP